MSADAPEATPTGSDAKVGINRRTVVRGAAVTAWAVPAVTLVTAAPAFAVSSVISVTGFTANYLNHTNAATVDPTKLAVSAKFGNTGVQATKALQFTLSIPGGLYRTAPTATTPAGWGAPAVSGSLAGGWTLVYSITDQLTAGASNILFDSTITFTDPAGSWTDAPFRRWGGTAFSLSGSATATNATPAPAAVTVAATPTVPWVSTGVSVGGAGSIGIRPRVEAKIADLYNGGRSSTGQITVVVRVNKAGNSSVFGNTPQADPQNTDNKWDFIGSNVSTTPNGPWLFTFRSKITGYAPTTSNGGPGTDLDGPEANNSFYTEIMGIYAVGDTTVSANGSITVSAPHAETKTV